MSKRGLKGWGILLALLCIGGIGGARAKKTPADASAAPLLLAWEGRTMGTTYQVKIAGVAPSDALVAELRSAVEARFDEINREMSNYRPDSELSRFNRSTSLAPIKVSAGFAQVVRHALALSRDSGGAFDPTVGPLVNLWGFGPAGPRTDPPADAEVEKYRATCGASHLRVTERDELQKDIPDLQLDLGGIAKGYGADEAAKILLGRGHSNIFVAVCGEIVAFGNNPEGKPWQVGIERPIQDLPRGADYSAIVALTGRALSTSGDTYNYFLDAEGKIYSHILDPATGRPIQHKLASVTVIAPDGLTADGMATSLYVMGPELGLDWIEAHPGVAALFILRTGADEFKLVASSRFPDFQSVP